MPMRLSCGYQIGGPRLSHLGLVSECKGLIYMSRRLRLDKFRHCCISHWLIKLSTLVYILALGDRYYRKPGQLELLCLLFIVNPQSLKELHNSLDIIYIVYSSSSSCSLYCLSCSTLTGTRPRVIYDLVLVLLCWRKYL